MARRLEYEITTDASKGVQGLKAFSSAAKKELKSVTSELDDSAAQAEKVSNVFVDMAAKMESGMKGSAAAAEALAKALGPEIAGRADLDSVVADLEKMGVSLETVIQHADKLAPGLKELDRVGQLKITGDVERKLADIREEIQRLTDLGVEIPVELSEGADKLEAELKRTKTSIEEINDTPIQPKVDPGLRGINELDGNLTRTKTSIEEINDTPIQPKVDPGLRGINEIAADTDRLTASLKQVGQVDMAGADSGLRRTKQGLDDVQKSAGSSRSVLANMVGNATQDLGALAGVAGSAGVAIGQMGEYMVDAKVDGDKLSKILKNFATVAIPIAAIGVAVKGIADARERAEAAEEWRTDQIEAFVEAMREGADAGDALAERLREIGKIEIQPGSLARAIGELDVSEGVAKAGLNFERFATLVEGGTSALDEWVAGARAAGVAEDEIAVVVATATQQIEFQTVAAQNFNKTAPLFEESLEGIAAASKQWADTNKPMSDMPKTWRTAADAVIRMRQGLEPTADQLQAVLVLTQQYGIDATEVYSRAAASIDEHNLSMREMKAAADEAAASIPGVGAAIAGLTGDALEAAQAQMELAEATKDAAVELVDAQDSLNEMATVFHEMERREGAMQTAFDLGNAPVEAKKQLNDINNAISDLQATADEELDLSVKLDPDEIGIRSGFRGAIDRVRSEVQGDLSRVFAVDGADAARTTALSYIARVTELLGGAFTSQEVAQMLGLDQFEVLIDVALEQESLAEARAELDLLAGLPGADPLYVAQIQLALDAGTLSPQAASVLLAEKLGDFGLNVPTELLPADPADLAAAKAEADTFVRNNPLIFNSDVATPDPTEAHRQAQIIAEALKIAFPSLADEPSRNSVVNARNAGQRFANQMTPIQLKTALTIPGVGGVYNLDAGGTANGVGGVAGEKGPEFARFPGNGRQVLLTEPTYVPPGTRVTSRKQTARILRTRGLRRYDMGGVVTGGPVTVNVNAGVVGNRYDVMRAVQRANLDKVRLLGSRS